jgi:hypothetical protein
MDNIFMIHLDDYIQHIDDKLTLYAMLRQLEETIKKLPDCQSTAEVREQMTAFLPRIVEMWNDWNIPLRYLVSGELDDLCDVMDDELMEPEDAGYFSAESYALTNPDEGADHGGELAALMDVYVLELAQKVLNFADEALNLASEITSVCDDLLSGDEATEGR